VVSAEPSLENSGGPFYGHDQDPTLAAAATSDRSIYYPVNDGRRGRQRGVIEHPVNEPTNEDPATAHRTSLGRRLGRGA
jgi:hypothetical protein